MANNSILVLIGAILLASQFLFVNCVKLNSDGGYEIVLALNEDAPQPNVGVERFIDNVKTSLQVFSGTLWKATKERFYLKSVDILIPNKWNKHEAISSATTQNYGSADIRVSSGTVHPYAENLNQCGQPGNAIDLPINFFDTSTSGPHGLHAKSLLHLWAIYRFGVHPEHGYIGNNQFPYFNWNSKTNQLEVTGCSNQPLKGKFVDLTNPDVSCENSQNSVSNENCRFVPDLFGQNANSSLLHFHWIDSVTEFCDSHSHNKHSANKQNALCDHKSVWEVIRESSDYKSVTDQKTNVPVLKINLVQHSETPLFYLLLDRGSVQGSASIANFVPPALAAFLSESSLSDTVAAIGAYPGTNENVDELVEWSEIGKNRNSFLASIGELKRNGSLQRDFSRAIQTVADKIKKINHPNGAVILIVKFGADVDNFDGYLPEAEVLNSLNEGNIILNSIELDFPGHTGMSHLAEVCKGSYGTFTVLKNYGEVEQSIRNVLNYVRARLRTPFPELKNDWKTLRKDIFNAATAISVPYGIKNTFQMFVSSNLGDLKSTNFTVLGSKSPSEEPSNPLDFRFKKGTLDWNEEGSKYTYRLEVIANDMTDITRVGLRVSCNSGGSCANSLLARGEFTGDVQNVKISVITSLENNAIDLTNGKPLSIFAKVTKNDIPVAGAQITASLKEIVSSSVTRVELIDDGKFAPDLQENDGVYSGYFVPDQDGTFELTVAVKGSQAVLDIAPKMIERGAFIQLIPVDQKDTGCGLANCNAENLDVTFSESTDFSFPIAIQNVEQFKPHPQKILTLDARDQPARGQVDLYWEAPIIPGRSQLSVSSYEIRSAPEFELLIDDFERQTIVPIPPNHIPQPPVRLETVTIARPSKTMYYAVRSIYQGQMSPVSNIIEVNIPSETTEPPFMSTTMPTNGPSDPTPTTTVTDAPTDNPGTGSTDETTVEATTPDSNPTGPTETDNSSPTTSATVEPTTGTASQSLISISFLISTILFSVLLK